MLNLLTQLLRDVEIREPSAFQCLFHKTSIGPRGISHISCEQLLEFRWLIDLDVVSAESIRVDIIRIKRLQDPPEDRIDRSPVRWHNDVVVATPYLAEELDDSNAGTLPVWIRGMDQSRDSWRTHSRNNRLEVETLHPYQFY